ncbi:alcohol dehydrogenase catalytic domain-containing protein [Paracoccus sp. 1_MG-2023]|uniref:zinc-dependent alcohol dehydrogenase n=1 Tax=unclassified Paracoccus (in: a-proteobacteria) TaxID=2688777 RepID=UPI001C0A233A|nr:MULTISPECIES: alcohol dehydrogenase catalytic domain-containing protein [unclassified Paracoccus (in: a-proteobacteria)]MBU2957882.1 alcohol dehydrogenase catalytic domain-containing protein [Paracoccus sp. C2R09]MDO6668925.1 alcohol dehydrogenase catalytic domain-containing protein [Paracoccus sp. 1_MG-2023]
MKAMVYTGVKQLELLDLPDPRPADGEALVRVEAVGICGSDMHAWAGHDDRRPAPLILGHEAAGTVIEGSMRGCRVTVNPLVTCGDCPACRAGRDNLCGTRQIISMPPREGAFAELLAIPERNLVVVPDHVTMAVASLTEPLACGWHAVRLGARALDIPLNEARCLVMGGGAIGLGAALVLRAMGAGHIFLAETSAPRRRIVQMQRGIEVFDPAKDPAPRDIDLVIDGVGFGATRAAGSAALRPGGVFMHIGLGDTGPGFDIRRATLQELSFIGTYTYTAQDFRDTAQAIFDGRLGALDWAETAPLTDGPDAFRRIAEGRVAAPKITLLPGDQSKVTR